MTWKYYFHKRYRLYSEHNCLYFGKKRGLCVICLHVDTIVAFRAYITAVVLLIIYKCVLLRDRIQFYKNKTDKFIKPTDKFYNNWFINKLRFHKICRKPRVTLLLNISLILVNYLNNFLLFSLHKTHSLYLLVRAFLVHRCPAVIIFVGSLEAWSLLDQFLTAVTNCQSFIILTRHMVILKYPQWTIH